MHGGFGVDAGRALTEAGGQVSRVGFLLRRGEHQDSLEPEPLDLSRQSRERAGAEDHPSRTRVVDERLHQVGSASSPFLQAPARLVRSRAAGSGPTPRNIERPPGRRSRPWTVLNGPFEVLPVRDKLSYTEPSSVWHEEKGRGRK